MKQRVHWEGREAANGVDRERYLKTVLLIAPVGSGVSATNVIGESKVLTAETARELERRGFDTDIVDTSGHVANLILARRLDGRKGLADLELYHRLCAGTKRRRGCFRSAYWYGRMASALHGRAGL